MAKRKINRSKTNKKSYQRRNSLLSIWLWVLLIGNILFVCLSIFNSLISSPVFYIPAILSLSKIIFVVALLKWKKWGFYGFCTASILSVIENIYYFTDWMAILSPILNALILYAVIRPDWKKFK